MKKILIIGAGGFGKEVVDLIRDIGGYDIIGFLDDNRDEKASIINHIPVIGTLDDLDQYRNVENVAIAIANPKVKKRIYEYSRNIGFQYPNLIHPTVIMGSDVKMGRGNIVCANSLISTEVLLLDFITINPQCGIGHESKLYSFTTLYWSVNIGGNTSIQGGCELGSKSCVLQGLRISEDVILGACSVAVRDILDKGTYVGVPARKINSAATNQA